jgi:hypothetical protein
MREYFDENGNAIKPPWIPTLIIAGLWVTGAILEATNFFNLW